MNDCAHPMCRDEASFYDRPPGRSRNGQLMRGVPHCLAHHLEFKYRLHVEKKRQTYVPHPKVLQPCGTTAAARRHQSKGEPPCDACRGAVAAHWRERRAKAKQKENA